LTARLRTRRLFPAFTLLELLLVCIILVLLMSVATPALARLFKTSKVEQSVNIIMGVLWRASGEAQRLKQPVGVFFGDEPGKAPISVLFRKSAGVWEPVSLPPQSKIEVYTVLASNNGTIGSRTIYTMPTIASPPSWMPFRHQMTPLTTGDVSLPDGVRVLFGKLENGYPYISGDVCLTQRAYKRSPDGEAKRHEAIFHASGSTISFDWSAHCYNHLCVFDNSGAHAVLKIGDPWKRARPKLIYYNGLKGIGYPPKKILKPTDLTDFLDNYPPDS
jgi:Tfp pilus assembly protein FimT